MSTTDPTRVFGSVADSYDRGRPGFPREVAAWLAGPDPVTVLELGAGTGKLTEQLVALGHDVHATDPDPAMLRVLAQRLPDVRTSVTGAEELAFGDRSFDVVVAAQSFHWFDTDRALPEIARVLKPHGTLALVRNDRDTRIPWVRKLGVALGDTAGGHPDGTDALEASDLFDDPETARTKHWQVIDRHSVQDLARSYSFIAGLDERTAAARVAAVLDLYDDYGRGMDGMQLPWVASAVRASVRPALQPSWQPPGAQHPNQHPAQHRPEDEPTDDRALFADEAAGLAGAARGPHDTHPRIDAPMVITTGSLPRIEVDLGKAPHAATEDSGVLLIDFR